MLETIITATVQYHVSMLLVLQAASIICGPETGNQHCMALGNVAQKLECVQECVPEAGICF